MKHLIAHITNHCVLHRGGKKKKKESVNALTASSVRNLSGENFSTWSNSSKWARVITVEIVQIVKD